MLARLDKEISELRAMLHDENQAQIALQMMVDSKDSEIEQLHSRLEQLDSFIKSDIGKKLTMNTPQDDIENMRLEGYLSIPNKQNIKKHGWRKQYVVVSSRKIIFYNSEADKAKADPVLILDLS